MNFKKILVLLMALIMAVGAFAPAIHAFNYANIEKKGEQLVEDVQVAIDKVVTLVSENYEQAYSDGYTYALDNGYIDLAVDAIDDAIVAIEDLDLTDVELSQDLKSALEVELDACVDTLGKVKVALETNRVDNVYDLMVAVRGLVDDLGSHLDNLSDVCAAGLKDEKVLSVVDDVKEALASVDAAINAALNAAADYIVDAVLPYYDYVSSIVDITVETFEVIVRTVAKIHTTIVRVHNFMVDANLTVSNIVANVKYTFNKVMEAYSAISGVLVRVYGKLDPAFTVATQIYDSVIDLLLEYKGDVKGAIAAAKNLYNRVVDILVTAYGQGREAVEAALEIYAHVTNAVAKLNRKLYNVLYNAFNANYVLNENSYYVALGNAPYAEELADMVHLGNKFGHFDFDDDYKSALAGADLVTIDLSDDEIYDFAVGQVMGKLSGIVRGNKDLMAWYNDERFIGPYIREALDNYGVDINAQVVELDWEKHLDDEGMAALNACLAKVKAEAIEHGIPEIYTLDLGKVVLDMAAQNGYIFPGVSLKLNVEIPVADLVVFAVENIIYKHVEFTGNLANALENIEALAPDATVVITGLTNNLGKVTAKLEDLGVNVDLAEIALEAVVGALNLQLVANAFAYKNVIFVPGNSADDIFDAINFRCDHKHDDCDDLDCNLCGEVREAIPHSFTKYVFNNDSTCTKNGTETAVCDNCDKIHTREAANSMKAHNWENATCTTPKTCKDCGKKEGVVMPHKYGDWDVLKDPTDIAEGLRQHTCTVCGFVEQQKIPPVQPKVSVPAIIGIVILAAAVICGASAGVCYYKKKKNS